MARVSLTPPRTFVLRLTEWYSRRAYGKTLDPVRALAHNPRVLWSDLRFERSVAKWNRLDPDLKGLAEMATAAAIGCSWCMDFGYWAGRERGTAPEKVHDVPVWRDSDAYTPLERDVMAYAEAMTATPPTVDDELVDRLRERLGEPALVELTAMVAVENLRSRINSSLGLTSQGFKDSCEVPASRSGDRTSAR
ncbi:carboxymuconolactone decarboxylase family protein [Streptomyces olivochromogenes]|uniref:carboxymuconolactone decarboxylase family protein n=1 Tax=Streptomyces olivochromogenes TaxID=1963 RepID=UPI001F31EF53|nr:carboxymuconolactone decarboxylase family protein [Streptomyces olivochromogenes]MCF3135902.1 carboxymuconolactone decarboxylase family protein [Streptomyces olivochromogenes]